MKKRQNASIGEKQDVVVKGAESNAIKSKKRRTTEEGIDTRQKRPCVRLPAQRKEQGAFHSTIVSGSLESELQVKAIPSASTTALHTHQQNRSKKPVLAQSHSRRNIKLPRRYQMY